MKHYVKHLILVGLALALGILMAACASGTPTTQPGGAATEAAGGAATQAAGGGAATEAAGGGAATEAAGGGAATQPAGGGAATQVVGGGPTQTLPGIAKTVNLDPAQASDPDSKNVDGYIYEPLVGVDKGQTVAWLANTWTVAEDKLAYTFVLNSNVKFSDGSPLNAEVVIGNFNRWFDPADSMHGTGAYKAWSDVFGGFKGETGGDGKPKSAFDGIEKAGDFTVVIHLNRQVAKLDQLLAGVGFSITKPSADGKSYLGTGAYMVGEQNAAHLVLVPNPNYTGPFAAAGDLEFPFK
jgi:peptide/nickel transport system substrate-binding protein